MSLERALQEANETLGALLTADVPEQAQPLIARAESALEDLIAEVEDYMDEAALPDASEAEDALRDAIRAGDVPRELRLSGDRLICDGSHVARLLDGGHGFVRRRFESLIERVGHLLQGP